jgi:hypothetical protein
MRVRSGLLIMTLAAIVAAGCGGDEADRDGAGPAVGDPGPVHVHGVGINPADGALFIATHTGLFRSPEGSRTAKRVAGRFQDTMGFTVVGPDHFLGSGHPDGREGLPPFLGLIRSQDAGKSWNPVSLLGKQDFHVLEASGRIVYGYGADFASRKQALLASANGGRSWEKRKSPEPLTSLVINPDDAKTLTASGEQAVHRSEDGGSSWRPIAQPGGLIARSDDGLVLITAEGTVHEASQDGASLRRIGQIGGPPAALESTSEGLLVALHSGIVKRSTDGGRQWSVRFRP